MQEISFRGKEIKSVEQKSTKTFQIKTYQSKKYQVCWHLGGLVANKAASGRWHRIKEVSPWCLLSLPLPT